MHNGSTIADLVALVFGGIDMNRMDLARELSPWEIIVDARTHLANKPMTEGDEAAWLVMEAIQEELIRDSRPYCEIRGDDGRQNPTFCGKKAVTFCRDCGLELCEEHRRMVAVEVYCESCGDWAEGKIRAMLEAK